MSSPLQAGLDWTGTPSLNRASPYGPCIVGTEDVSVLETEFAQIRVRFGIEGEVKGHSSKVAVLSAVLETLLNSQTRVGALVLDKSELLLRPHPLLAAPAILRHQMACAAFKGFIELQPISQLLCDEDIRGKREWEVSRTEILRINRATHPNQKLKVSSWPSEHSVLIQAADVVAYVFSRAVRNGTIDPQLYIKLRALQSRPENRFEIVKSWGE